jgi:hypothetical protein
LAATLYNSQHVFLIFFNNTKTAASIGIDLGHSSVKTSIKTGIKLPILGGTTIFPTVVRDWVQIANEETARRAEADTVEVNGKKFLVGGPALSTRHRCRMPDLWRPHSRLIQLAS